MPVIPTNTANRITRALAERIGEEKAQKVRGTLERLKIHAIADTDTIRRVRKACRDTHKFTEAEVTTVDKTLRRELPKHAPVDTTGAEAKRLALQAQREREERERVRAEQRQAEAERKTEASLTAQERLERTARERSETMGNPFARLFTPEKIESLLNG